MDLQKKRSSTLVLSSRSRQSSSSRRFSPVPCSKCVFCRKECTTKHQQTYFPNMINKALYSKYSSSQNYYYTRGLNEFITNARTTNVIRFKDNLQFEEEEEYLKRFYKKSEYPGKIEMLTEYYKFHKDIARLFMLPSTNTVNRYHDKKRRLEYIRVTKMLQNQNQDNKSPTEMHKTERLRSVPITDRVLDDLELTQSDTHGVKRRVTTEVSEVIRPSGAKKKVANKENTVKADSKKSSGIQEVKVSKDVKGGFSSLKKPVKGKAIDESNDQEGSQTIQELNWKLGEIIHNSYSQNGLDVLSYFENSEQQPNDTISNLNNFLEYIQVNAQSSKLSRIPAISSVIPPASDIKSLPNTHRSPDTEPKSTSYSTSKIGIKSKNPSTSHINYNNQMIPEATLATELLRRVSLDQPRKGSKKVIYTDIDRPLTTVTTTRASVHPTPSAARSKNKQTPVSIKIQGFEEALRSRQPTSPRQMNSQHSTSRERVATKFSASLSHRAGEIKSIKYTSSGEANLRGVLTSRRESQTNSNILKASHKASAKKKESFNIAIEKNNDTAVQHTSQNLNTRPSSHRDMRISLDMYAINRHMSQPGMVGGTITTTYTEKTEGNFVKIQSSKAKQSASSGVQKVKEIKHLSTLGNMDIQDKDIRSVPSSKTNLRTHVTSRGDYRSSNRIEIIPEQDIVSLKRSGQQTTRKALTHRENNGAGHKSHKSEVKFGKLEAGGILMKKGSLPQSVLARDVEQACYEERRYTKERESSPSKHGYTYNHNNIVNIYVQSRPDTTTSQHGSKENIRGMGLGKANTRKSDAFEIASKQTSCRESPSVMSKKEESSSIKMKNIYGSSLNSAVNTYNKPVLPARTKSKVELDLMEKRIKVSDDNHYEIFLKIKGK